MSVKNTNRIAIIHFYGSIYYVTNLCFYRTDKIIMLLLQYVCFSFKYNHNTAR